MDYDPNYNPFNTSSADLETSIPKSNGYTFESKVNAGSFSSKKTLGSHVPDQWEQLYQGLAKKENADDIAEPQTLFGAQPEAEQNSKIFTSGIIEDKSPSHYQYKGTYIMNAVKSGLMIIDQHRAHVRILYEHYLAQLATQKSATQTVLFPESFQLSASQRIVYEKIAEEMATMGFDIQDLGAGNYAINGIPAGLEGVNPVRLVVEMVDTAAENTVSIKEDIDESLALSMARNAAIPQGQVLSNIEMENIVNSLFLCKNPNVTPDGKTILCILKQSEIEHLLG